MTIKHGEGRTKYGPGVSIELDGDEVAIAIGAWLVAHGVHVSGPRTITVNGELCERGKIYVDPSGFVITQEGKKLSGNESPATDEQAIAAALADGWELDSSPGTEMSNETWYRLCPTKSAVREEDLIERYSSPRSTKK